MNLAKEDARKHLRQLIVGLVALPLSTMPFVAWASLTPEGRLVRARASVALNPPTLPQLSKTSVAKMRAHAPRYADGVVVLAYHGIGSPNGEGGFVIQPERFAEHLAALRAAGMNTVTAAQVAEAFAGGPALPANAVTITFDDGRTDAMLYADPLLKQARMRATMFVIADSATNHGVYYASWDQLKDYARDGRWDIQAHTARLHRMQTAAGTNEPLPALTSLQPGETREEFRIRIRGDLLRARQQITEHIGAAPVTMAYPFGAYGTDRTNDPAIEAIVRDEVGKVYQLAFEQDDQDTVPLVTCGQDPLRLRRVDVKDWSGADLLARIARAAHQPAGAKTCTHSGPLASP